MRRAWITAVAVIALGGRATATYFWDQPQNTVGFTSPVTSSCFLYASAAFDVQCYTPSTGLTLGASALTVNLSTGIAGGQAAIGGTGTTDSLTLKATSATPASGAKIYFQTQFGNSYYDPVAGTIGLGDGSAPISMFKAATQLVAKSGGDLQVGTVDGHGFELLTNGLTAVELDSGQHVVIPILGGVGNQCVEADNTGQLFGTGAVCGTGGGGGGTVTSVTGTAPISCSPSSPNPVCSIALAADMSVVLGNLTQADFPLVTRSTNAPSGASNLGSLIPNGDLVSCATSAGVCTPTPVAPSSFQPAGTYVTSVTGSSPISCSPTAPNPTCSLSFDGASLVNPGGVLQVGTVNSTNVVCGPNEVGFFNGSSELTCVSTFGYDGSKVTIGTAGLGGVSIALNEAGTQAIEKETAGDLWVGAANAASLVFYTSNVQRTSIDPSGYHQNPELSAPAVPAASTLACWADSTAEDWTCKSHGGVVTHGVQTNTGTANNFVTAISAAGAVSIAQPAFSNLSGSATCTQLPALTGDTTSTVGTCGTTTSAFHDFSGQRWGLNGGTLFDGGWLRADVGGGKFIASGTIGGDGTSISCSNSGIPPENLTCGVVSGYVAGLVPAAATKMSFSLQLQLSASIPNTWLLQGGAGLFVNGALIEYPNDFKAGHIQVTYYLRSNVITAGILTVQASLNGSAISGTAINLTSASSTGVHTIGPTTTGSTTAVDTYGLVFQTNGAFASTSPTSVFLTFEVVLTP